MSEEMPPRGWSKIISDKPWEGLGLACTFYNAALTHAGKEAAKASGQMRLANVTWDEALDFYCHTDPNWQKAVSGLISGNSVEDTWKAITLSATDIVEFDEKHVRNAAPQIRYWANL